jgi:cyclase
LGGAGSLSDITELVKQCGVIGASAGSMFVYKGRYKAVLINYLNQEQKDKISLAACRKND